MIGRSASVSQMDGTSWRTIRTRSRPAPVSMLGLGSGDQAAVGLAVVLHEHQVPELDEALLAAPPAGPPSGPQSGPRS